MALKIFRSIGDTLKIAKTPEQRAYVVASAYGILLHQAAKVATRPGTPKKLVESLSEIVKLANPVIDDYVDAVRFKSSQVPALT